MKLIKNILIGIVVLALLGVAAFFGLAQYSQSGSAPGLADGRLQPCPGTPNCVSSEAGTADDHSVEPFSPDVWDALPAAIEEIGGTVTQQGETYIAAEFKSATFGFVDDVEFRLTDEAVHVRSASRVGYSDAGANAARVDTLAKALAD